MKDFFKREISNWRFLFLTLIFISVLAITLRNQVGLTGEQVRYIYYLIYCLVALSYLDFFWKKIKKRKPTNDILDDQESNLK